MRVCQIVFVSAVLLPLILTIGCTQSRFNRAQEYELAGQNATALQMYQQILATTPDAGPKRAEVLMRIGECLYHMDRMQEAFTSFQKAAEADPNNTVSHLRMGEMLLSAGAPDRAREEAESILRKTPSNTEALALLGASWAASENFDLARQAYERVLNSDPKRMSAAVALADIYNRDDNEAQARKVLRNAATQDPNSSVPWLALARLEEQDGNAGAAETAYRKAISIENTPETNLRLAQFLQRSTRIAEAEQTLRKVDAQRPSYPVALADFQLLAGRPAEALELYRRALNADQPPVAKRARLSFLLRKKLPPADSNDQTTAQSTIAARMIEAEIVAVSRQHGAERNKAMAPVRARLEENRAGFDSATVNILEAELALADNNLVFARSFANLAKDLAPNSAPAHYVAGLVAAATGDSDGAQIEWQNALDQDSHFDPARLALAEDALARGDGESADLQARLVVRDNPGDLQAVVTFSRALLMEGKTAAAAIMAQRASSLDPTSPEPFLILGEVALKVNNPPQGLLNFERALTMQPDSEEAVDGLLRVYRSARLSYAAMRKMEKVAADPPASSTLLEIVGRLYADRGLYSDAIRALKHTVDMDPKRTTAARILAQLQANTGDYQAATQAAMKAGVDSQSLLTAFEQQNAGDWKKAAATYERALRAGEDTGVAANNIAWLYAEHNVQLDRALSLAQSAAHVSPNNPAVLDTLGYVHLQRREYSDAVKLFETAARITKDMASLPEYRYIGQQVRKHLRVAYMLSGQTEAAEQIAQNRGPFALK
ncbi:MAG: tetratricopeptide repeat protein [Terriglobales bacterium]